MDIGALRYRINDLAVVAQSGQDILPELSELLGHMLSQAEANRNALSKVQADLTGKIHELGYEISRVNQNLLRTNTEVQAFANTVLPVVEDYHRFKEVFTNNKDFYDGR